MRRTSELVMGTAQLGMLYGAANRSGMPSRDAAFALIRCAIGAGVKCIDTARAYGEAEERIGAATTCEDAVVVTKVDPLVEFGPWSSGPQIERAVLASLDMSRYALRREVLHTVLLHRATQRTTWEGWAWRILREQRAAGAIRKIGVSVTTPEEALSALEDDTVEHIQLPFNIVDRRWERAGVIGAIRERAGIVVHVRSVFLQGLLCADQHARWPIINGLDPVDCLARLHDWSERCCRSGSADLCLAYVRGQDWIDGVVIGMETQGQLLENLELFAKPPLSPDAVAWIEAQPDAAPLRLVDIPSWPSAPRFRQERLMRDETRSSETNKAPM